MLNHDLLKSLLVLKKGLFLFIKHSFCHCSLYYFSMVHCMSINCVFVVIFSILCRLLYFLALSGSKGFFSSFLSFLYALMCLLLCVLLLCLTLFYSFCQLTPSPFVLSLIIVYHHYLSILSYYFIFVFLLHCILIHCYNAVVVSGIDLVVVAIDFVVIAINLSIVVVEFVIVIIS